MQGDEIICYKKSNIRLKRVVTILVFLGSLILLAQSAFATGEVDRLIKNEDWEGLKKVGAPAVTQLIRLLKHEIPLVRAKAAETLGVIGDKRAADSLIDALYDKKDLVVRNAIQALEKITGENYGSDDEEWQLWLEDYVASQHKPSSREIDKDLKKGFRIDKEKRD